MRIYLISLILLLSACTDFNVRERGNGKMVEETYKVSDFNKLHISGAYDITMVPSDNERVEVKIDENLVEYLNVDVRGSTLIIENIERITSRKGIDVVVFYRSIEKISISGACDLESDGVLVSDLLTINMSGAGAVDLEIDAKELELIISGAGAVKLEGRANHQSIEMSGAGGYSGFGLISQTCRIDISGVGNADVYVEKQLDANISGLGGIGYRGNPENVHKNVSGLGSVRNAD